MILIYKIANSSEWEQACTSGTYVGSDDDRRDGFIHFSTKEQLAATYKKYFRSKTNLRLICIEDEKLGKDLKWEPSRGGDLFPHLYAPLPTDLILWDKPICDGECPNPTEDSDPAKSQNR